MNAPETIKPATHPINVAHEVLMKATDALCVHEVARAIFGVDKPTKSDLRDAGRMLKEDADLGLIERAIPRCPTADRDTVLRWLDRYAEIGRRIGAM